VSTCLLLLSLGVLGTGDDAVALKELGITLPRTIANIEYGGKKDFEPKALGYALAYNSKMCKITLIVYDLDMKQIPPGKASPLVQEQMKASIQDIVSAGEKGFYKNLQRMKDEPPLPKDVAAVFAVAGFTFDIDGGSCKSYIFLTAHNGYFVKVRVTQYVVNGQTNDEEIQMFLVTLAKKLTPAPKAPK
jgi:hypothetical protein